MTPRRAHYRGEIVDVEWMDLERGTALVRRDDRSEPQPTTLESLRAPSARAIEPGTQFDYRGERVTVTDRDLETNVIGYRTPGGEFDLTLAESVPLERTL